MADRMRTPFEDADYIAAEDAALKAARRYHDAEIAEAQAEVAHHQLSKRQAVAWHALTVARRDEFAATTRDDRVLARARVIKAEREFSRLCEAIGAHLNAARHSVGLLTAKHDAERAARAAFAEAEKRALAALDREVTRD